MKKVSVKLAQFENSYYLCIAIEENLTANSGDSLAQLVEHNTFNVGVLGSSPRRITRSLQEIEDFFFIHRRYRFAQHLLITQRITPYGRD